MSNVLESTKGKEETEVGLVVLLLDSEGKQIELALDLAIHKEMLSSNNLTSLLAELSRFFLWRRLRMIQCVIQGSSELDMINDA